MGQVEFRDEKQLLEGEQEQELTLAARGQSFWKCFRTSAVWRLIKFSQSLWLLWYYSPNQTRPNSQGMFFCLPKMMQLSTLCWGCFTALVQSCQHLLGRSWRQSSIVHVSPAIQESELLFCSFPQNRSTGWITCSDSTDICTKFMRYSKQLWLFDLKTPHLQVVSWTGPCYLRVPTY